MNFNNEIYPNNIPQLVEKAEFLAVKIKNELNSENCPVINDLYTENENKKVIRQKTIFNELGIIPNNYLSKKDKERGHKNELKGLYIMGEYSNGVTTPVYIGISRTIFRRIRQHAWGKNHNECTLAYLKTRYQANKNNLQINRATVTDRELLEAKEKVRSYRITFVPIESDYELYFLEVALAGILKAYWNSFKTH